MPSISLSLTNNVWDKKRALIEVAVLFSRSCFLLNKLIYDLRKKGGGGGEWFSRASAETEWRRKKKKFKKFFERKPRPLRQNWLDKVSSISSFIKIIWQRELSTKFQTFKLDEIGGILFNDEGRSSFLKSREMEVHNVPAFNLTFFFCWKKKKSLHTWNKIAF